MSSKSLVDSIFGSKSVDNDEEGTTTTAEAGEGGSSSSKLSLLFETKFDVPSRPKEYETASSRAKKNKKRKGRTATKDEDGKEVTSKKRKQQQQQQQQQKTNESVNDEEDVAVDGSSKKEETNKEEDHVTANNKASSPSNRQKNKDKNADDADEDNNNNDDNNDDQDRRTIFVGNLPCNTTRKSLYKLFVDIGPIDSTRIRSVSAVGVKLPQNLAGNQNLVKKVCTNTQQIDTNVKNSVSGYVVYRNVDSVEVACLQKNRTLVDGRHIRVDHTYQPKPGDPTRSVFVGNLPYQADEETLELHFLKHMDNATNKIENIRIVRDKETQLCKGFAYILFSDRTCVLDAIQKCHEKTTYMKRTLRVQVCGKRYKNRQGTTTQPKAQTRRQNDLANSVGALQRVLKKKLSTEQSSSKKKKRARGGGKTKQQQHHHQTSGGVGSKRAASQAKTDKRIKKIEKRISKGMGKARRK